MTACHFVSSSVYMYDHATNQPTCVHRRQTLQVIDDLGWSDSTMNTKLG
jgi:hypothetical protein